MQSDENFFIKAGVKNRFLFPLFVARVPGAFLQGDHISFLRNTAGSPI